MIFQTKKDFKDYIRICPKIGIGSSGICFYDRKNKQVLKVFHQFFDELQYGYDKKTHIEYQKEDILKFSAIEVDNYVFPTDVIIVENEIIGYTTNFIKAKSLYKQDPLNINLEEFQKAIEKVKNSIKKISENGILTYDLMYNILYNGNFYIIDHDEYTKSSLESAELLKINNKNFNYELFLFLIDGYFDEFIQKRKVLKNMYQDKEIDILEFLKLFRNKLSETMDFSITTLQEASKVLNKKRKTNPIYERDFYSHGNSFN